MKEQVSGGAASAVTGHAGLAAVGVEDANAEVGDAVVGPRGYGNTVSARAVMTIADTTCKISGIDATGELFGFENQIIISKALEFCESHFGVRRLDAAFLWPARCRRTARKDACAPIACGR